MKIHSAANKHNIVLRVFSIFPLFFSIAALSIWGNTDSLVALVFSILFGILFFYTFFLAKNKKYIDTDKRKIIRIIDWLWIHLYEEESLEQYESVCICLGAERPASNWTARIIIYTYDVALIRKYTSRTTLQGYGALENFPLKVVIKNPEDAKEIAIEMGELLKLKVTVDKAVTKLLKRDLL